MTLMPAKNKMDVPDWLPGTFHDIIVEKNCWPSVNENTVLPFPPARGLG
jgi:hypothetical protein